MKGGREGEGEEEGEGELCEKQRGGESEERLQFLAAQFLRERKRERESSAKSKEGGESEERLQFLAALAAQFLSLLRAHSKLKKIRQSWTSKKTSS